MNALKFCQMLFWIQLRSSDGFLPSFHIVNSIDWFLNVKPCSWNEFYLVMIYYFYSTEFNLLVFCKDFLCLYLGWILICSFFLFLWYCLFWFWHQDHAGLIKWIRKCSFILLFLRVFVWKSRFVFLRYVKEFINEAF